MTGVSGDTIAAQATAPGTAAIAIVRLSGPDALDLARRIARSTPRPRRAELCDLFAGDGCRMDRGLVLYFPGPNSYTGEDTIEFQIHGGQVVADWLLESLYRAGARPAEPGEFTLRAFLNDKLDLAEAEAVADLIDSGSRQSAQAALRSLSGEFSARVNDLQAALTALRVQIEAWLDFPDEEIDRDQLAALCARGQGIREGVDRLLAGAGQGRALRDGLSIVIAGLPNAGKSSLLNRLLGYEAAIVTHIPGTTRDTLREHLQLDGMPLAIVDTAGLRRSSDPVEREGVRRAQAELAQADRVLWVADSRDGVNQAIASAEAEVPSAMPVTILLNKIDLIAEPAAVLEHDGHAVIQLSMLTDEGFDLLRAHLKELAGFTAGVDGSFSARRRHVAALTRAADHLRFACLQLGTAMELGAEELRAAQVALSELTGELTSDDLLGEIFSKFCLGK